MTELAPPQHMRIATDAAGLLPASAQRRLTAIFDELRGAPVWPWTQRGIDMYRGETLPFLYGQIEDEGDARMWRARIEGEMARLDASSLPL